MILSKSSWWMGGGHVKPKQDDSGWKYHTYRGTNLSYDILCEHTS